MTADEVHRLNAELDAAKERTVQWMDRYNAAIEAERNAEAEVRERIAQEIEALRAKAPALTVTSLDVDDAYLLALAVAARIARGGAQPSEPSPTTPTKVSTDVRDSIWRGVR